jgi:hypothetical protein
VINFNPDATPEENKELMVEEMSRVKTGQVTYAVRNTSIDGYDISENDIMGIGDSRILAVGKSIQDTTLKMLEAMADEDTVLISVYYGADVTEEDAEALTSQIQEQYPDCDVDVHAGGQPVYYYVVSVE